MSELLQPTSPGPQRAIATASVAIEHLTKTFANVTALDDLSLGVAEGEMLVLVGPSGCGKTTCLRCLAGLEKPTAGRILIGDKVVTAIENGIFVSPNKREIGMVFQSYAVWPHMTVFENVAYPLRAIGAPRASIPGRVAEALRLVQLDHLAQRYSSELSGGQQQRVALARSLVAEPKLLLFDEPLSNLDANLRLQMRVEIKQLQKRLGFTGVYVTHDQAEALAIADRVAIMRGGVLQQIGTPREVYDRPANAFVAGFMGVTNILEGAARTLPNGTAAVELDDKVLQGVLVDGPVNGKMKVSIRPEAVKLVSAGQAQVGVNAWPGRVVLSTFVGDTIIYHIASGACTLEVSQPSNVIFDTGSDVVIVIDPARCRLLKD